MTPVRILAITESSTITGPSKNLLQFDQWARQNGEEPPLALSIAAFHRQGQATLFVDTVRAAAIPLVVIDERRRFDRSVLNTLRRAIDTLQPQIIQTHGVKAHFLARYLQLHHRAAWIAFQHGYTWPDWRMRLYNQLDRWSLRAATRVVTMNEPFKEHLIRWGVPPERIEVLHNAIDPAWGKNARVLSAVAALRETWNISADTRVILMVGRLSGEKDPINLLRAVAALPPDTAPWKLVVVGEGPERAALEREMTRLKLQKRVLLTGHVASAESFYGLATVCVLPSRSEGSPNALLEAMVAGVPVVATRVGGVPEILEHDQEGFLIPPQDAPALTAGLRIALEQPDRAQAWAARAQDRVRRDFAPETRMRRLRQIYLQSLAIRGKESLET